MVIRVMVSKLIIVINMGKKLGLGIFGEIWVKIVLIVRKFNGLLIK